MRSILFLSLFVALAYSFVGCQEASQLAPASTWHEKFNWKAEDYFDDPQVIALCRAIEANDFTEIDRLVAAGANVNIQGKGKMTPALWAFPDNKLPRFTRLLEHGANPNVIVESDFGTQSAIMKGDSVTHMAAGTWFPGYFEAVFEHGGDPNLVKRTSISLNETPLFSVIKGKAQNKLAKVKTLIAKGANLNHVDSGGLTPTITAVGWGAQYDIALLLLESGADHRVYKWNSNSRLIHSVLAGERRGSVWTPQQKADYEKVLRWLEDHGESIEQAKADRKRWESWSITTGEYQRKMTEEVAAREVREANEQEAKQDLKEK